ncbi:Peripheral-type benzodiazepine receptor-associated protein 1, partial [Frankliniella fusca]
MVGQKRRQRQKASHEDDEDEQIHCLCRTEEWGHMVECTRCLMWCHYQCVHLSKRKGKPNSLFLFILENPSPNLLPLYFTISLISCAISYAFQDYFVFMYVKIYDVKVYKTFQRLIRLYFSSGVPENWMCPWCERDNNIKNDILRTIQEKGVFKEANKKPEELNTSDHVNDLMKKNTQLVEEKKLLLEEIEKQRASCSKNLLQLQEENDSLKASVSSLQSRNENVANKKPQEFDTSDHVNNLMKKNTELVEKNKVLLEEIEKQKTSLKNLLQLQVENDSLKVSVSSLQSRNEDLERSVRVITENKEELEKTLKTYRKSRLTLK